MLNQRPLTANRQLPAIACYATLLHQLLEIFATGCDINYQSAAGETALTLAIRQECFDVAKQLLSMPECDIDAGGRNPPLHVATFMGKERLVVDLMRRGADVNKVGINTWVL